MGEGISAGIESGYCLANAIIQNMNNPETIYDEYKNSVENLRQYVINQWDLVGSLAGSFKHMCKRHITEISDIPCI